MRLYEFIKEEFKKCKKLMVVFIILSLVTWSINLIMPKIIGEFIDNITKTEKSSTVYNFTLIALIFTTLSVIISYFSNLIKIRITNDIGNSIKSDLVNKLLTSDENILNNYDRSYLTQRFFIDVDNVVVFSINNIIGILIHSMSIVIIMILVFGIDIIVGYVLIGFVPIYIILYSIFKSGLYQYASKYKEENNLYYSLFSKIMNSTYHVKTNGVFKEMETLIKNRYDSLYNTIIKYSKKIYLFNSLGSTISGYSKIAMIFVGGLKIINGKMTIGEFTVITTYFTIFMGSINYFLELGKSYQDTNASLYRTLEILQLPKIKNGKKIIEKVQSIEIKDLSYFYGEKKVIKSISFKVDSPGIYCINGNNGEGKTTLLNLIIGLFESEEGTIKINGTDLGEIDKEDLWKNRIAFQEQHVVLFGENFYEYLTFGLNDYNETNIAKLISYFELEYLLEDQDFTFRVLSGGEKRKISLIRLLLKESSLLVLDEPLTYLDKFARKKLLDVLQTLSLEKIIVVVAHEEMKILGLKYINLNKS